VERRDARPAVAVAAAVTERNDAGDDRVRAVPSETPNDEPGGDWHSNPATQVAMAAELGAALSAVLGW